MHYNRHTVIAVILILATLLTSCGKKKGIIPRDVMSEIYYDIYMADQAIKSKFIFKRMADTLMIYEPIFNRYGYTTEDYSRSVEYYLERPAKFEDIFEETKLKLEKRRAQLQNLLIAEGKRPRLWNLIDSLELYTSDSIHAGRVYKNLRIMFFKPDTLVPDSPVIDSAFLERPVNQFLIFNDSALNADRYFKFYEAQPFMTEVARILARRDSLENKVQQTDIMEEEAGNKPDDDRKIILKRNNFSTRLNIQHSRDEKSSR